MDELLINIPSDLYKFLLVAVFSLLIGLSQKNLHAARIAQYSFGTDRTFTFIGILGYVLYIVDPNSLILYSVGLFILSVFLVINYYNKIANFTDYGLTTIMIALITYSLAPLVFREPFWLSILVVVTVLIFAEMKETLTTLSEKLNRVEFITLGKFLAIAGIILPLLPNVPVVSFTSITPYKLWLAVVVISSISYLSYLLRKFVFTNSGILVTGILGGLYSSTATTFILSRKSKFAPEKAHQYSAAIIIATTMMYIRILILAAIFNIQLFILVYPVFLVLIVLSSILGLVFWYKAPQPANPINEEFADKNPLEFKVAIIFTLLYLAFTLITSFTIKHFGASGLNALSYLVGFSDIDPFLLNLFQGKFTVGMDVLAQATLQAIISNNILKYIYTMSMASKSIRKTLTIGFTCIIIINFLLIFFI
ncbi:MAG: DUF4010 domain-containing protein [Bacteroidota bacterium]|nr:DUF4010 domain-containing protein [Bacteroidota bacterium]